MIEMLLFVSVLVFAYAIIPALVIAGATLYAGEQARKAANRQAEAMEKASAESAKLQHEAMIRQAEAMERASEHLRREQQFMEELRRGFLEDRQRVLARFGRIEDLADMYLQSIASERGGIAEKIETLANDPAILAGARLAVADALGLNRETARRMVASLIGSGAVRGSGIARALLSEEVRRQQETERQLADLARQEALDILQMQQQASQLRESIARERFQVPLGLEEAFANRALGIGSNIAGLAQSLASAQMQGAQAQLQAGLQMAQSQLQARMQAQQFLAQQDALRAQQLAQGIGGLAQAYQQQQMMNQYFNILRNSPLLAGGITGQPVYLPYNPPQITNSVVGGF